jgi:hypothetical protein
MTPEEIAEAARLEAEKRAEDARKLAEEKAAKAKAAADKLKALKERLKQNKEKPPKFPPVQEFPKKELPEDKIKKFNKK